MGKRKSRVFPEVRHRHLNAMLRAACKSGDLKALDSLLGLGADPFSPSQFGKTAFHVAAAWEQCSCMDRLVNLVGQQEREATGDAFLGSILFETAHLGRKSAMRHLMGLGVKMDDACASVAMRRFAGNGDVEGVRIIVSIAGAAAGGPQGEYRQTPLMSAAEEGHAECVEELLAISDPNAFDLIKSTALMLAASNGHLDCVRVLLPVSNYRLTAVRGSNALEMNAREMAQDEGHGEVASFIEDWILAQAERSELGGLVKEPVLREAPRPKSL